MKELDDFTVERLQRIIRNADGVTSPTYFEVSPADIAALARIALAAKTAEPVDISFIEGMEVSVDVSTCDADADHRYFGTVTEVSELDSAEKGYILLVKDAKPNFPAIPDGWTNNGLADSVLVMLDRIDTLDPDDDVRIEEVKRIVRQLAIALQPQNEPQNIPNNIPDICKWTYDEHDYKWDSACGESWQFTDGGPEDNHVKFCQGCGKHVELQPATEG